MSDAEAFDFVVVGAGTAGCAVASRLSESGRHTVLLLEAGGKDRNPWIRVPLGTGKVFNDPKLNWGYESEPEPALGGRVLYQPRGKVLGGTGSINGMIYVRGHRDDYDGWARLGCTGWSLRRGAAVVQACRGPAEGGPTSTTALAGRSRCPPRRRAIRSPTR